MTSRTSPAAVSASSISAESLGRSASRSAATTKPRARRRHAAKGSRIAALSLSVVATGVLTGLFAETDRADAATITTATAAKSFTGAVDTNKWGPVQVSITVAGGKITNVKALQTPNHKPKSVRINQRATPILKAEALTAQSSSIQNVSGATYTADSYKISLQSAIDQAVSAGVLVAA